MVGLNLNAPVKFNGVDVGKVQAITLDHTNPKTVNLFFAKDRGTPVKEDTGIAYVEPSGGSGSSALLHAKEGAKYPAIRTAPSLSARLENVLSSVLAKLDDTYNNINAILGKENQSAFSRTLADLAKITRTVAARKDSIGIGGAADSVKTMGNEQGGRGGGQRRGASGAEASGAVSTQPAQVSA